jgi:hypothetical protein
MNPELGLKILANLLEWSDDTARAEYRWLAVMSGLKYDGYQDFVAGKRFVESLISWLKQFRSAEERAIAYEFVRRRLVYLGPSEMQHLVRLTYPEHVRRLLLDAVARRRDLARHEVLASPEARAEFERLRRATLFVGLSDGARIDVFRRANVGILSNEQVVAMPQFDRAKWADLAKDLREALGDTAAAFEYVVLLDDFVGSGSSVLRWNDEKQCWTGKLVRFRRNVTDEAGDTLAHDWHLVVHHYAASAEGRARLQATHERRVADAHAGQWFSGVDFSFSAVLPTTLKMNEGQDTAFLSLADRYYDPAIETKHFEVGGHGAKLGFAGGALPLVLDHNTPNNSIALLWAESDGENEAHAMRPLFRRRQRHL